MSAKASYFGHCSRRSSNSAPNRLSRLPRGAPSSSGRLHGKYIKIFLSIIEDTPTTWQRRQPPTITVSDRTPWAPCISTPSISAVADGLLLGGRSVDQSGFRHTHDFVRLTIEYRLEHP